MFKFLLLRESKQYRSLISFKYTSHPLSCHAMLTVEAQVEVDNYAELVGTPTHCLQSLVSRGHAIGSQFPSLTN